MKKVKNVLLAALLLCFVNVDSFAENGISVSEMEIDLNFSTLEETESFDVIHLENYLSSIKEIICTVTVTITVGVVSVSGPCSEIGDAVSDLIDMLKSQLGLRVKPPSKPNNYKPLNPKLMGNSRLPKAKSKFRLR